MIIIHVVNPLQVFQYVCMYVFRSINRCCTSLIPEVTFLIHHFYGRATYIHMTTVTIITALHTRVVIEYSCDYKTHTTEAERICFSNKVVVVLNVIWLALTADIRVNDNVEMCEWLAIIHSAEFDKVNSCVSNISCLIQICSI